MGAASTVIPTVEALLPLLVPKVVSAMENAFGPKTGPAKLTTAVGAISAQLPAEVMSAPGIVDTITNAVNAEVAKQNAAPQPAFQLTPGPAPVSPPIAAGSASSAGIPIPKFMVPSNFSGKATLTFSGGILTTVAIGA